MPPTNSFNTLRGAWSGFYVPSGLLQFGRFGPSCLPKLGRLGPSCLGPTFFMGRVVLGRLVFGLSCPEPEKKNQGFFIIKFSVFGGERFLYI